MLNEWLYLGIFMLIAGFMPAVAIIMATILSPKKPNLVKNSTYECGIETVGDLWVQFKPQYYIYALIFLVFDVETVFLYPWAVAYNQLSLFGVLEAVLFVLILLGGLLYAWRIGALEWSEIVYVLGGLVMIFLTDPVTFLDQWLRGLMLGMGIPVDTAQIFMQIIGAAILAAGPLFFTIFLIWVERKLIGRFQDRLGPNRVGPWGIFQPFADMVKIFTKELITPAGAETIPFNLAPILTVASVIMLWAVVPFMPTVIGSNINVGALYIIAVGALGTLGIILAGWSSNNKYALLGAFRAVAQLISYEVPMVIVLLIPVMLSGSMGMNDLVRSQSVWFIFLSPLGALIFFISLIAEVGRSPFDLLEADSELVSGFNIEYSGLKFGFFYVADFLHAFTIALLFTTVYLGGWQGPFVDQVPVLGFFYLGIKTVVSYFIAYSFRASLPRFRIDQMMDFNWKLLTPLSLLVLLITAVVDKVVTRDLVLVQVVVAWVFNFLLLLGANQVLRLREKRNPRLVVAPDPLPVARLENN